MSDPAAPTTGNYNKRPLDPTAPATNGTAGFPPVRRGFLAFLALAITTVNGAMLAPSILTLSLKSSEINQERATSILSSVIAIGSIVAIVGFPVIGRLSDRSLNRLGRRRPFMLAGAVLIAVGAVIEILATNVPLLAISYVVLMVGIVSTLVGTTSLVPDKLPPEKRGTASAIIGLGNPVGAVIGTFLAQLVQPHIAAMIGLPAAVAIVAIVLLVLFTAEEPLRRDLRPEFSLREFLGTFWVNPLKHSGFAWAWSSRLLIFFGIAAINSYQAFYLIMVHHIDQDKVGTAIFLSSLILMVVSLVFAPLAGKISDKVGRRKPFVFVAAAVFAVGLVLTALAPDYRAFLVAVAIMGVGQGVYLAVDFALVTQVLPDPNNPGKDIGIMNIADKLPSSLVPAVAPVLLAIGASASKPQNFVSLFIAGAIAAVIGALCILPIRKAR